MTYYPYYPYSHIFAVQNYLTKFRFVSPFSTSFFLFTFPCKGDKFCSLRHTHLGFNNAFDIHAQMREVSSLFLLLQLLLLLLLHDAIVYQVGKHNLMRYMRSLLLKVVLISPLYPLSWILCDFGL